MSFTQEKETNISVCDGCEKRCKFGFHEFNTLTNSSKNTVSMCCPTIDGKPIMRYKGKNGQMLNAAQEYHAITSEQRQQTKDKVYDLVREIVRLCDHYKTR